MKKQGILVLVMITVLFVGFVCGLYIGKNYTGADILVSKSPETIAPVPTAPSPTFPPEATLPDETTATEQTQAATLPVGKINLNTATKEQLTLLPGIGEVLAERIIRYRDAQGPFKKVHDLLKVEGIGEKKLDAIIDYLTV